MLKHILTGGIDLPKLESRAIGNTRAIANVEIDLAAKYEETNKALADHIAKAHEQLANRALAEDVETLRLKLDRVDDFAETTSDELHDAVQKLATIKANHEDIAALRATVAGLSAKVEALTNTKLAEVKARKAPKKDAAK